MKRITLIVSVLLLFVLCMGCTFSSEEKEINEPKISSASTFVYDFSNKLNLKSEEGYKVEVFTNIKELKENSILLVSNIDMDNLDKNVVLNLIDEHNIAVLYYGEDVDPEKVVEFFEGLFPVVPLESSLPLKYQSYGVLKNNKAYLPLFTSVSSDKTDIDLAAIESLILKIKKQNQSQ